LERLLRNVSRLWALFLLLVSGALLVSIVLDFPTPWFLTLLFYLYVPGYAFVAILFRLNVVEETLAAIGFSVCMFLGLRSLIQTFRLSFFPESMIFIILSLFLLILRLAVLREHQ